MHLFAKKPNQDNDETDYQSDIPGKNPHPKHKFWLKQWYKPYQHMDEVDKQFAYRKQEVVSQVIHKTTSYHFILFQVLSWLRHLLFR